MNHRTEIPHILIIEPNVSGHHGTYLQWIVEGLAEHDFTVTLMTLPESLKHPSLRNIARNAEGRITVVAAKHVNRIHNNHGVLGLMRREFAYWRLFHSCYQQQMEKRKIDAVLLPYFDYCLYAIALFGSPFGKLPFVGIAMRPSFHYPEMGIICPPPSLGRIKKALFFRLLRNKYLKYLLSIDESLIEFMQDRNKTASEKIVFLPEPCDLEVLIDANEAKKSMGIDIERKMILVYGALSSRKGVIELLRSTSDSVCQQFVDVVLAGKIQDELQTRLDVHWIKTMQQKGRLTILDHFITDDEERILFSAADIVWLGYHEHYTASGVLIQAARVGLPVIACKEGIIGWQTRRHKLGIDLDPTDNASIVEAIVKLTKSTDLNTSKSKSFMKGFENHDASKAKDTLANCLG